MEVFVRVVELGGFSPAARAANMTPSAVSKLIARLEARLGARLVNRSTRQLQLTPEGCAFYERATRILADIEDAERAAGSGEQAVGRVRLNTSASYFNHILAPILPDFLMLHPGVSLDIVETDVVVDLLAERTDVAVRAGPLKSSSLVARKLGETALTIVAAPSYLERCGEPRTIADLEQHNRLGFGYAREVNGWPLRDHGETIVVPVTSRVQISDGEGLRHLALAGVGLARIAAFTVRADIAAGRLVPVLGDLDTGEKEAFHAVYVGQGGPLPSRVRALLDFLAARGRVS
ncbi:LysR family transcriptional regulator [Brucella pseudintermedia]|nr:LysR family transcriptional regulator [Brucella pseudintermedia]